MNATKESEEERRRKNYFYPALDQDRAGAMLIKNTMNRRIMAWSPRSQNASVNDKVKDKELSADGKRALIRRVNREVNNQLNVMETQDWINGGANGRNGTGKVP